MTEAIDIDTPHGPARAHLHHADDPRAALVLGHGAGGGVQAPDLKAATAEALERGVSVALVEQPYRVAGKKSSPRPNQLDPAWLAVTGAPGRARAGRPAADHGRAVGGRPGGVPHGGGERRGGGAVPGVPAPAARAQGRHARRQPPGRAGRRDVPMLVVQGVKDRFGMPASAGERTVVQIKGDHSLRSDSEALRNAVGEWLSNF